MNVKFATAFIFGFLLAELSAADKKLPDYVKPCKRNDPKESECWKNTFIAMLPHMVKGIPEMGISPIDPASMERIVADIGHSDAVKFHAVLHDIKFTGFKDMQMANNTLNTNTWECFMQLLVPKIELVSPYEAKGKVLLFQFDSKGNLNFNFSDVTIDLVMNGEKFDKNGKGHLKWKIPEMQIKAKVKIHFENLFPDNQINEAANQAFNEGIDLLFEEVKPFLTETLKAFFLANINKVYSMFPLNVLHLE